MGGKQTLWTYSRSCTFLPMNGQAWALIAVACGLSVLLDWSLCERVFRTVRQADIPGQFTYSDDLLLRKILIAGDGGFLAVASYINQNILIGAAITLWLVLHFTFYFEWYRFAKRHAGAAARDRKI